jgi:hypothetical protein
MQDIGRQGAEHCAEQNREAYPQQDDLSGGLPGESGILFADAPRDNGGCGKRDADGDCVDQ